MTENYIESNESLRQLICEIKKYKIIAVDTEFTRKKTYYPVLSLIQIAVNKKSFIIDCLKNIDLELIFDVIFDDNIVKIFHSPAQDLEIFYYYKKSTPKNIQDTQIMANIVGIKYNIGYSSLVKKFFDIDIDKSLQNSDWQKRPLSNEQIDYALSDVIYLEEIYHKLNNRLKELNRLEFYQQDLLALYKNVNSFNSVNITKNFVKKNSFDSYNINFKKIENLIIWREKLAQNLNLPRKHCISDYNLFKILNKNKHNLNFSEQQNLELKKILSDNSKYDLAVDLDFKNSIMNERQKRKYHEIKTLISNLATEMKIEDQVLISSPLIKNIILKKKTIKDSLNNWRYNLFGKKIETLINK